MDTQKDQSREVAQGAMIPPSLEPEMVSMDEAAGIPMPVESRKQEGLSPLKEAVQRLRKDKRAAVSLSIVLFFVLIAIIGPPIYQRIGGSYFSEIDQKAYGPQDYHNYTHQELDRQNELPSGQYWLGTDQLGRDILARMMQGVLISIVVALLVEFVNVTLGILIGVLAGFYGGWIDQLLARFADLMFAFPGLLLIILISGIFGSSADTAFSKIPFLGADGNARLILVAMGLALTPGHSWHAMFAAKLSSLKSNSLLRLHEPLAPKIHVSSCAISFPTSLALLLSLQH